MITDNVLRVVVIGAGGHARVCIEALSDDPLHHVVGAVSSDGLGIAGLGIPVLGREADLPNLTESVHATTGFVAVGDNQARAMATQNWLATGFPLAIAVSRFAAVSSSAGLAAGVAVLPGAVVNAATVVDRGVIVNTNASVDHDCRVGEFSHIAPGTAIGGGVTLGAGVMIGIGASVMPGVTIGDGAVVGAGAVVIDDVPAGAVVVGCPARPIERADG